MDERWIIDLHAVFDGNRRLEGGDYRKLPGAGIVISGTSMRSSEMAFDEFLDNAESLGLKRLMLAVSDAVAPESGWEGTYEHPFVLAGDPAGSWQVRRVAGTRTRWVYDPTEPPTRPKLGLDEVADRLRHILEVVGPHVSEIYKPSVSQAVRILDGGSPPWPPVPEPFGMAPAAKRVYSAAMQIGGHKLVGMAGFTDLPTTDIKPVDVVDAVAQAIAASTRP